MKRRDFLLSSAALGSLALVESSPATAEQQTAPPAAPWLPASDPWSKGASTRPARRPSCSSIRWSSAGPTTSPSRCTRPKHPANPLVVADQPWEGWRIEIYGNVIFDREEQIFKMWYIGESPAHFPGYAALYATSTDGIHWQKPLVGTIESRHPGQAQCRRRRNGRAQRLQGYRGPRSRPPLQDDHLRWDGKSDSPNNPDQGYHTFVSPDGLNWTRHSEKPICHGADVITGYYDRQRSSGWRWPRSTMFRRPRVTASFWLITSSDFTTWSPPQLVLAADARDDAGAMARIEEVRRSSTCPTTRPWFGPNSTAPVFIRPKAASWPFLGFLRSTIRPATAIKKGHPNCSWP